MGPIDALHDLGGSDSVWDAAVRMRREVRGDVMIDLNGKVALISGAARGQGECEARLFADLGASVVVGDILEDEGQEVANSIGSKAAFCKLDVTSSADWTNAVSVALGHFGQLDILVNNAGIAPPGVDLQETSEELFMKVIAVNQLGVFLGMKSVFDAMRSNGSGSIINISSTAGFRGVTRAIPYSATKWAVRGMTKTAAIEYGPHGIRVNSVHPGVIDTAMVGWDQLGEGARQAVVGDLPISRIGGALEVARMVAFLASDASAYSTGSEFIVDGGSLAGKPLFRDALPGPKRDGA
jgi:3alpha(or 20beta)-hydroxysteroid dehydrogenase